MDSGTADKRWGRVFMGGRLAELCEVEKGRDLAWNGRDEELYLEKVRLKAEEKAREILAAAETEARGLRARAEKEGYAAGLASGERELEELRSSMRETARVVLAAIQERSGALFDAWREDLTALTRLAVERGLGLVLKEEKAAVLEAMYTQAVGALEEGRDIIVRCNPEDAPAVEDIVSAAGGAGGGAGGGSVWKVLPDPGVEPGGIVAESASSLTASGPESRKAAIMKVLDGLSLPPPPLV